MASTIQYNRLFEIPKFFRNCSFVFFFVLSVLLTIPSPLFLLSFIQQNNIRGCDGDCGGCQICTPFRFNVDSLYGGGRGRSVVLPLSKLASTRYILGLNSRNKTNNCQIDEVRTELQLTFGKHRLCCPTLRLGLSNFSKWSSADWCQNIGPFARFDVDSLDIALVPWFHIENWILIWLKKSF